MLLSLRASAGRRHDAVREDFVRIAPQPAPTGRRPLRPTLNDLLVNPAFQSITPRVVLAKLHALRKEGNRAAHGEAIDAPTALWLLKEAFDLGCWLHLTYGNGSKADLPAYAEPPTEAETVASSTQQRAILEKLAAQEAQMQKLLDELEAARSKAAGEPPRKVYGFHSKDSLKYLRFQLTQREPRAKVAPAPGIIDRLYQHEAVKKVVERFAEKKRKALLVQATGTGKTRVAVALCSALIRARWARRILFLCDRRELRKQARNVFKEFMPGDPHAIITSGTAHERDGQQRR